jgi:tetratricopeptide (TPR) repeat protein
LALFRRLGDQRLQAIVHELLTSIARVQGDREASTLHQLEEMALFTEFGDRPSLARAQALKAEQAWQREDFIEAARCYGEALRLYRKLGDRQWYGWMLKGLGRAAYAQGMVRPALAHWQEGLRLFQAIGIDVGVASCLEDIARAVGEQSYQPEGLRQAVVLLSVAAALRARANAPGWPEERAEWARLLDAACVHLVPCVWEAAWTKGQAMSREQAIAYALGEDNGEAELPHNS